MKQGCLFIISTIMLTIAAQTQTLQWLHALPNSGSEMGTSIAADVNGNIYVTGKFTGAAFNPGKGGQILSAPPLDYNIFLAKYDTKGNCIWAKSLQGGKECECYKILLDEQNNIYITGTYNGTIDFDPGPAAANITLSYLGGLFLAKYDNNGNYIWAKAIAGAGGGGGANNIWGNNTMTLDNEGDVLISGTYQHTVDFNPGKLSSIIKTSVLTAPEEHALFIAKYDGNGKFIWAKSIGTIDTYTSSITVDKNDNVIVAGWFSMTGDFNPGLGIADLQANGKLNAFIAKYNKDGKYMWAKPLNSEFEGYARSVAVDEDNNIIIGGEFSLGLDFDPSGSHFTLKGNNPLFLAKYSVDGNFMWAKMFGSKGNYLFDMHLEEQSNVYLIGQFWGGGDFDPGDGGKQLTAVFHDMYIAKYDKNGNYVWAVSLGDRTKPQYVSTTAAVAVDSAHNVIITGWKDEALSSKDFCLAKFTQSDYSSNNNTANQQASVEANSATGNAASPFVSFSNTRQTFSINNSTGVKTSASVKDSNNIVKMITCIFINPSTNDTLLLLAKDEAGFKVGEQHVFSANAMLTFFYKIAGQGMFIKIMDNSKHQITPGNTFTFTKLENKPGGLIEGSFAFTDVVFKNNNDQVKGTVKAIMDGRFSSVINDDNMPGTAKRNNDNNVQMGNNAIAKNDEKLSEGAALLFNEIKSNLTIAEKNQIYDSLKIELSKDKKQFVYKEDEEEPIEAQVTIEDLNKDNKQEVFIIYGNSFYGGIAGRQIALFISDANDVYHYNLGFGAVGYMLLDTKHLDYPDLSFDYPGMTQPIWRWNGKAYQFYKSVQPR